MTDHTSDLGNELQKHLERRVHWRTVGLKLLAGVCLLAVVVWVGRDAAEEITAMEAWIDGHGIWGRIAFVALFIVLTSVLVPDSLLLVAAGAMFGLVWGTALVVVGAVMTAALNYAVACDLLRPRIEKLLETRPKLQAIRRAANSEGLRLQLLLRLAPLNQVSINYVLGASGVRFSTFMIATLGQIPNLFAVVYFGYLGSHMTKVAAHVGHHSTLQTALTVVGFVVCTVLMIYIAKVASKAIAEAGAEPAAETSTH